MTWYGCDSKRDEPKGDQATETGRTGSRCIEQPADRSGRLDVSRNCSQIGMIESLIPRPSLIQAFGRPDIAFSRHYLKCDQLRSESYLIYPTLCASARSGPPVLEPRGFPPQANDLALLSNNATQVGSAFSSRLIAADFVRDRSGKWHFLEAGPGAVAGTAHEAVFKYVGDIVQGGKPSLHGDAVGGPL